MDDATGRDLAAIPLRRWRPVAMARPRATRVVLPLVPAIDAHQHLGTWLGDGAWMAPDVGRLLADMDAVGVERVVNLDGRWGDELLANLARYDRAHPDRIATFCHVDWRLLEGGVDDALRQLAASAAAGARGVKVWKDLGLGVRVDGARLMPDDPRVVRVLQEAGALGLPVLIHTADPMAFFAPLDERNERLDELAAQPDWWFGDPRAHPTFDALLDALGALVQHAPGTTFVGAHMASLAEDLDRLASLLDALPNLVVDTGGRMAELGRQPRGFARLVARHPDRVLFGSDAYPADRDAWQRWWRFLETDDEAFDYEDGDVPSQGRWQVAAAALPAAHLHALYRGNAERVLRLR